MTTRYRLKQITSTGLAQGGRMTKKKNDEVWMPHAAHLIVGDECRFHLATYVNGFIVSTVGEYVHDGKRRTIGRNRFYETMVFVARPGTGTCCPWVQADGQDVDFEGYNDAGAAREGHMRMVEKYRHTKARKPKEGANNE